MLNHKTQLVLTEKKTNKQWSHIKELAQNLGKMFYCKLTNK